jgi:hypothetical protein
MGNKKMELDAESIRVRAERKWAQLHTPDMKAKPRAVPGRGKVGRRAQPTLSENATLAEMHVSKATSARAHKLAEIPDEEFEKKEAAWRKEAEHGKEAPPLAAVLLDKKPRGTFGTGENEWFTPSERTSLAFLALFRGRARRRVENLVDY